MRQQRCYDYCVFQHWVHTALKQKTPPQVRTSLSVHAVHIPAGDFQYAGEIADSAPQTTSAQMLEDTSLGGLSRVGSSPLLACRYPSNYEYHIIEKIVPYMMSGFVTVHRVHQRACLRSSISSNHHIIHSAESNINNINSTVVHDCSMNLMSHMCCRVLSILLLFLL